jgi:peptide/nickel transport system permease protein
MNSDAATLHAEQSGFPAAGAAAQPDHVPQLSQTRLMWRRFRRNRLAMAGGILVILAYMVALSADFIAYADPRHSEALRVTVPPQGIIWTHEGRWDPHIPQLSRSRDPDTLRLQYAATSGIGTRLTFFGHGYQYHFLGLIETDRHLIGTAKPNPHGVQIFLLGSDTLGRDLFSRLLLGLRTSLFVGLAAVFVSLLVGVVMGITSGYFGGKVDLLIQRLIEVLRAIPTIPLWMGLAAAIPAGWSVTAVYIAITMIIALIGWTELARELRGRIMSLRNEDFVLAARLSGAGPLRIMRVHMLPSVTSHIIAATTLAIPGMIVSETALGYLGLGLRSPAISLGVLLKDAQDLQNLALNTWLMIPAIPTALIILAFNFFGDGLRDAADPYG